MAETLFFNALREAIDEEMSRDSSVFILGEDVGHYGGSYKVTKDLHQKELKVAIKGDAKEEYPTIKKVIDILQDQKINKFFLVTGLRTEDF